MVSGVSTKLPRLNSLSTWVLDGSVVLSLKKLCNFLIAGNMRRQSTATAALKYYTAFTCTVSMATCTHVTHLKWNHKRVKSFVLVALCCSAISYNLITIVSLNTALLHQLAFICSGLSFFAASLMIGRMIAVITESNIPPKWHLIAHIVTGNTLVIVARSFLMSLVFRMVTSVRRRIP